MSGWASFFVIIVLLAAWGVVDSAIRVTRWCYRRRRHDAKEIGFTPNRRRDPDGFVGTN